MENVTKRFGKVVANNAINLELREGEILSLLGENGSGKTTLMNMLSGIYFPDEGQIYIHGKPVTIASPKDAFNYGIGMIHQHFKLVDVFTATENIVLGLEGKLDLAEAARKSRRSAISTALTSTPIRRSTICPFPRSRRWRSSRYCSGRGYSDSGRAYRRPDAARDGQAVPDHAEHEGGRQIPHHHHPQAPRGAGRLRPVAVLRKGEYIGDVATKDADQQSLTDMMVGHSVSLNIDRLSRRT